MAARTARAPLPAGRITKHDIEAKLRELTGGVDESATRGRRIVPVIVGSVAVVAVAYRLGRWGGARHSTMLEIRRISTG